jgi:hypothetical protein
MDFYKFDQGCSQVTLSPVAPHVCDDTINSFELSNQTFLSIMTFQNHVASAAQSNVGNTIPSSTLGKEENGVFGEQPVNTKARCIHLNSNHHNNWQQSSDWV